MDGIVSQEAAEEKEAKKQAFERYLARREKEEERERALTLLAAEQEAAAAPKTPAHPAAGKQSAATRRSSSASPKPSSKKAAAGASQGSVKLGFSTAKGALATLPEPKAEGAMTPTTKAKEKAMKVEHEAFTAEVDKQVGCKRRGWAWAGLWEARKGEEEGT